MKIPSRKPRVFIGSSKEAFDKAQSIADLLTSFGRVECELWNTVFEPGLLNFDALEEMLAGCSGAVFVATPDIDGLDRNRQDRFPRPNVLLEFGLVAGRLGLRNVALCRYGQAELPSDLTDLTIIDMDSQPHSKVSCMLQDSLQKLRTWASHLSATVETIPRTCVVHGYSGAWRYQLRLRRWWGIKISAASFVRAIGAIQLLVSSNGTVGTGLAEGHIYFKITGNGQPGESVFQGEYRTSHEVTNTLCHGDGSMRLTTKMFALQRVASEGVLPPEISGIQIFPEPWSSEWILHPNKEPGQLEGSFHAEGTGDSDGEALLTKVCD